VATPGYTETLDQVRGIRWPALRRVRGVVVGPHVSTSRGTTTEFVEYRPYRQGDDPRKLDWKLIARTDRAFIRLSQERAILPTMLVLDASASMAFPQASCAKWRLASQLALGLAAVARAGGDPVGLVVAGERGHAVVAPRTRRSILDEMIAAMELAPGGSTPLSPATETAMRQAARIVLVTDFLGDLEPLLALGGRFVARGGELYAVHVVDREELEPGSATLLLCDPERPELRRPMSSSARTAYLHRFAQWREDLASAWHRAGAVYAMVVPEREPMRRIVRRLTARPGQGGSPR
jgi:uncharacterized protein (DUF58 family)